MSASVFLWKSKWPDKEVRELAKLKEIFIVAGIVVAVTPKFGGLVVAAWLWGIIINLLLIPGYYDIAARDFVLSLGALALARLSMEFSS